MREASERWRYPIPLAMIAIAATLAGCGGGSGGNGGGSVGVFPSPTPSATPTPTPTPTPSPSPTANLASIGAADAPTSGTNTSSPMATFGAPTFQTQPTATTSFPVLQTTLSVINGNLVADTAVMNGGSLFDFAYCSGCRETFVLTVPALAIAQASLNTFGDTPFTADLGNNRTLFVEEATWGTNDVVSTKFGFWEIAPSYLAFPTTHSAYVYGYQTPAADLPTSGTITYAGRIIGRVFYPTIAGTTAGTQFVAGDASVTVNFATGSITGQFTDMRVLDGFGLNNPWNSVTLTGALMSNSSQIVGVAAASSTSAVAGVLAASATGTLAARFYGPSGRELGLVWTLAGSGSAALGSSGTKR